MDKSFDVVVCGGGPAGIGAAIAAACEGVRTLLIEMTGRLGGLGPQQMLPFLKVPGDEGGIIRELRRRLDAIGAVQFTGWPAGNSWNQGHHHVNSCVVPALAAAMVAEAGAEILLHTVVCGVSPETGGGHRIHIANKGSQDIVMARVAVDATGDGDLAAAAGAAFDQGRPEDGRLQDVSLNFRVAGVEMDRRPDLEQFRRLMFEGIARGEIEILDRPDAIWQGSPEPMMPPGTEVFQFDLARGVDQTRPESLSQAEVSCSRQVVQIWQFLRKHVPGYERCSLVSAGPCLGIREGRRIRGLATLTEADVLEARKHAGGISRCGWYMDVHDGQRKTQASRAALAPPPGDYYEIPYGCLVPKAIDGLLVAGRCISATRLANGAMRIQATCMNTGQAAGVAAALCVQRGAQPREIDGRQLRQLLCSRGMEL
jgi:hypothetical protein